MLGDRWGVSDAEVASPYACDDLVDSASPPALQAWRGVTVHAPVERVWPWVCQIRVAPYSYDWVDNLGRRSPRRLLDLPEPAVGDPFTSVAGRPVGRVEAVDPGEQLTGWIMGAWMSYLLVGHDDGSTRLLLKVVMETNPVTARLVCIGDLVMARRQLLTLKALAESVR